jgi:hypothetical protein
MSVKCLFSQWEKARKIGYTLSEPHIDGTNSMYLIRSLPIVICLLAGPVADAAAQSRLPERGLDRQTVETLFGVPPRIEGPVGQPPITKWVYPDFIVVFEYDRVLHTVQRRPAVEQAPAGGGSAPATDNSATGSTDRQTTGDTLTFPE